MLKNTFCHIPGVGLKFERHLWKRGVSWDTLVSGGPGIKLPRIVESLEDPICESMEKLKEDNPSYFASLLPANESWRLFQEFRHSTAYLDIETNGLSGSSAYITTISLYDGKSVYCYVKGRNLKDFKKDIKKYKLIVTYNGKCFDIPFIESHLRIRMAQAHIDLRYLLRELGFSGGLKGCEKMLGIDRKELDGVDGYFAVLLWREFKIYQDQKALETLLAYNVQDVVNLETLMVISHNLKIKDTPFYQSHRLPMPEAPALPFKADSETIRKILSKNRRHFPCVKTPALKAL